MNRLRPITVDELRARCEEQGLFFEPARAQYLADGGFVGTVGRRGSGHACYYRDGTFTASSPGLTPLSVPDCDSKYGMGTNLPWYPAMLRFFQVEDIVPVTLATLPQASAQEVFDHVVRHLRRQGQQAKKDDICAYRGSYGTACAAGCLMTDEEYRKLKTHKSPGTSKGVEGRMWFELIDKGLVPSSHQPLIEDLQDAHDEHEPSTWEEAFQDIAHNHDLTYTAP